MSALQTCHSGLDFFFEFAGFTFGSFCVPPENQGTISVSVRNWQQNKFGRSLDVFWGVGGRRVRTVYHVSTISLLFLRLLLSRCLCSCLIEHAQTSRSLELFLYLLKVFLVLCSASLLESPRRLPGEPQALTNPGFGIHRNQTILKDPTLDRPSRNRASISSRFPDDPWTLVWRDLLNVFSPWALKMVILGGLFYTVGLVPWGINKLEFHNAVWHMFVLAGSACMLSVLYLEVSQPHHWYLDKRTNTLLFFCAPFLWLIFGWGFFYWLLMLSGLIDFETLIKGNQLGNY